jgi:D-alanyl-D-alanine carboxypeptidase
MHFPTRRAFLVAGLYLAMVGCISTPPQNANLAEIDLAIQGLVNDGTTAGISVAIQSGNDPIITKTYGIVDTLGRRPVRADDSFRIASVTKPITAAAVLKLVQMNKLSLDDPISRFFPQYPNGARITIHQLLSHTSGIPNWWDGELPADTPSDFPMCPQPHLYLEKMKNASLFDPGAFYRYSNTGYVLLGEIIEIVSGRTYERFLAEHVFAPAGMKHTVLERIERPSSTWVTGYVRGAEGNEFKNPEVYHMPFAAGGLRSTASDVARFHQALHDGKIIHRDLVERMTTYASVRDGRFTFNAPFIAPGAAPPKAQENIARRGYGYGFNLMHLYGTPVSYHSGGIAGFNSYLLHVPRNQTTIVLLANTEDGLVPALKQIQKLAVEIP